MWSIDQLMTLVKLFLFLTIFVLDEHVLSVLPVLTLLLSCGEVILIELHLVIDGIRLYF